MGCHVTHLPCQVRWSYQLRLLSPWSPAGDTFATGSVDKTARVWDAASGQCIAVCSGHTGTVCSVSWADSHLLASGSHDKTARVWDVKAAACAAVCQGHTSRIYCIAWNGDMKRLRLASGSCDGTIRVYDGNLGVCMAKCIGHKGAVYCVAWSGVSRGWLASASKDFTVRIWDASLGRLVSVFTGHSGPISSVMWSPDGRRLVSCAEDGTTRLWPLPEGATPPAKKGRHSKMALLDTSAKGKALADGGDAKAGKRKREAEA